MLNSSSSTKKGKESKPVNKKKRSSETPAKEAEGESSSEDSDIAQWYKTHQPSIDDSWIDAYIQKIFHGNANESNQPSTSLASSGYISHSEVAPSDENQSLGQAPGDMKDVNENMKEKVGADINAKKWVEGYSGLHNGEKSEVILQQYEVCLAKNIEYDLENDAAEKGKGNNKYGNFDTRRIFKILTKVNCLLLQDRRRLVEIVCQNGNVKLLENICQQEAKDKGHPAQVIMKYPWKGYFTGYETITDLLHFVFKQPCSPKIVLCIAERVYGMHHNVCIGRKHLKDSQIQSMELRLNQPTPILEECLKKAIELGYKDALSVMLSGDIYHCIRLMNHRRFQAEERFREALDMIEETVADVMSSWVRDKRQPCKHEIQDLLVKGVEIDIEAMKISDLIDELEYRGIKLSRYDRKSKIRLVEKLRGDEKITLKLRKTAVGALISTLFFKYQDEFVGVQMNKKPFELGISQWDENRRDIEINKLNNNIDSQEFVKERVLKSIQLLNSSSHVLNNWFFREVLEKVVNEKLNKLQGVCAAICKEPMQELLKGVEVHEDVIDVLKFFGVDPLVRESSMISVPEINVTVPHERVTKVEFSSPGSFGLKAAEENYENGSKNNCRQNKNIYHNEGKVPIIAPSGNICNEEKMIGDGKRKCGLAEGEDMMNKRE